VNHHFDFALIGLRLLYVFSYPNQFLQPIALNDSIIANMNSSRPSKRTLRTRLKVDYKESSSSSDDPIKSLQPSPSRIAKRKREDSLRRSTPESLQTQDSWKPDDPPLVRAPSAQRGDSRRESETSACSLPSDVPIFPHLERHKTRERSDSSSWSLPSDVPIFPYLREKGFNARESIAAQLSSPQPDAADVPRLDHSYLRYSETEPCHEKENSNLDIFLSKGKVFTDTVEVESTVPVCVTPSVPQIHDPKSSHSIKATSSTQYTTPKISGSPSINIKQKGNMAPGVSVT